MEMKTLFAICIFNALFFLSSHAQGTGCSSQRLQRAIEIASDRMSTNTDGDVEAQVIKEVVKQVYGGQWGVIVIKHDQLAGKLLFWAIDGTEFCNHPYNGWYYMVFRTASSSSKNKRGADSIAEAANTGHIKI